MSIAKNVDIVLENVAKAAARAGRKAEDITVIGVTKTVDIKAVTEMVRCGITIAGENRVQELLSKKKALESTLPELKFHMIGHLQTNKARDAVLAAEMIHSLDSIKLAEELNKWAARAGKKMDVLAQINIANENTKFGISIGEVWHFIETFAKFDHLHVRGLMCMAPFVEKPEENRPYFKKMTEFFIDINAKLRYPDNVQMDTLSMGMTQDYMIAIEEGATMVRIGTAIFGSRS